MEETAALEADVARAVSVALVISRLAVFAEARAAVALDSIHAYANLS